MHPDLLTQLVRAGNDGVIPAPAPGEDMRAYKFRAACAGAVVAMQWMEKTMADKAAAQPEVEYEGQPGDVTVTSPERTPEEIDDILRRRPSLNGSGARLDEVPGEA